MARGNVNQRASVCTCMDCTGRVVLVEGERATTWTAQPQLGKPVAARGRRDASKEVQRGLSAVVPMNNRPPGDQQGRQVASVNSRRDMYRCEAMSPEGFVQQLAVCYMRHGYWFYVRGRIPEHKDPRGVDRKLVEQYGLDLSKYQRARRKRAGIASVQLLRYRHEFVLVATHGEHRVFEGEASVLRDARRSPIRFAGYAIGYRGGHPRVAIAPEQYRELKAYFLEAAVHTRAERLAWELASLPFEPYAPVRRQLLNIWRAMNKRRGAAGFTPVPIEAVRMKRRVLRPFDDGCSAEPAGGYRHAAPTDWAEMAATTRRSK